MSPRKKISKGPIAETLTSELDAEVQAQLGRAASGRAASDQAALDRAASDMVKMFESLSEAEDEIIIAFVENAKMHRNYLCMDVSCMPKECVAFIQSRNSERLQRLGITLLNDCGVPILAIPPGTCQDALSAAFEEITTRRLAGLNDSASFDEEEEPPKSPLSELSRSIETPIKIVAVSEQVAEAILIIDDLGEDQEDGSILISFEYMPLNVKEGIFESLGFSQNWSADGLTLTGSREAARIEYLASLIRNQRQQDAIEAEAKRRKAEAEARRLKEKKLQESLAHAVIDSKTFVKRIKSYLIDSLSLLGPDDSKLPEKIIHLPMPHQCEPDNVHVFLRDLEELVADAGFVAVIHPNFRSHEISVRFISNRNMLGSQPAQDQVTGRLFEGMIMTDEFEELASQLFGEAFPDAEPEQDETPSPNEPILKQPVIDLSHLNSLAATIRTIGVILAVGVDYATFEVAFTKSTDQCKVAKNVSEACRRLGHPNAVKFEVRQSSWIAGGLTTTRFYLVLRRAFTERI